MTTEEIYNMADVIVKKARPLHGQYFVAGVKLSKKMIISLLHCEQIEKAGRSCDPGEVRVIDLSRRGLMKSGPGRTITDRGHEVLAKLHSLYAKKD